MIFCVFSCGVVSLVCLGGLNWWVVRGCFSWFIVWFWCLGGWIGCDFVGLD